MDTQGEGDLMAWTPLEKIRRVGVTRIDGAYIEFDVAHIVTYSSGSPMWFVHYDHGKEVVTPWTAIASIIILERLPDTE